MQVPPHRSLRIGMLSTFPPTHCGLATFSSALTRSLERLGHPVDAIRVHDSDEPSPPGFDEGLLNGSPSSLRRVSARLSDCDVAVIQHEFGIYGGPDGDEVLTVMRHVKAPILVVLHTVPQHASGHQAEVLTEVCERAEVIVVMSESARDRLVRTYFPIDETKVVTIPHGARLAEHVVQGRETAPSTRARFLTWGLIGPGKGIEHAIDSVGLLHQLGMSVRYTISGSVHPKVLAREGTRYRDGLAERARSLDVAHLVTFDEEYRGVAELTEHIASFDAVILPYDSYEQVTSGVLVDSLAAGRPVIATEFPHAVELLGDGAGMLVPHKDPRALAVAMHTLASEPDELLRLQARARAIAPSLDWTAVGREYVTSLRSAIAQYARSGA